MPSYWRLKYDVNTKKQRRRIIAGLEALRAALDAGIPQRTADKTLVLGTWNIRNFDDNRFGHGPRLTDSIYYLAEVISRFDVVAVQEVNRDLRPLEQVVKRLGYSYDYIITDVTEGPSGNRERLGFIYNRNKVKFEGVAGEIVLPDRLEISDVTKKRQFARTPFGCAFRSAWFKFMFVTVHIYYGKVSKTSPEYERRVKEIDSVARFLARRAKQEDYNYVLVGDFNIEDYESKTFDALTKHGFTVVKNRIGSNMLRTKFYDQISFRTRENELRMAGPLDRDHTFDVFQSVFTEADYPAYADDVAATLDKRIAQTSADLAAATTAKKRASLQKSLTKLRATRASSAKSREYYMREWRTYQVSDHLPLWVDLEIDFSAEYIERLKTY